MATLSKKLDLVEGIWQKIEADSFIGQKDQSSTVEMVNASSLPTGDIPECKSVKTSEELLYPALKSGDRYVRVKYGTGSFKYDEV